MRIESLSIRSVTILIVLMIGAIASILSLFAGSYFRQAALDAQAGCLSRVIEVATLEMLKAVRGHTFELGMRLGNSGEMIQALRDVGQPDGRAQLVRLLDDPLVNGFVGFANIHLEKIRVYDLDLKLVAESTKGIAGLGQKLAAPLAQRLAQRSGVERLKAIDVLWSTPAGPLHYTLVPIGGLKPSGYLEIVINPVFNLPDIGATTQTPISIFTPAGKPILTRTPKNSNNLLPVEYLLPAADGTPAFKIVGYENVGKLYAKMERTRIATISGFLLLTFGTLMFALWLFSRFLFAPLRRMVQDMEQMTAGKLDLTVNKTGLRDFAVLAETFNAMAGQVRRRTNDLERLLDMDDSGILCFGNDQEALYFNRMAATLFGYAPGETGNLDLRDLFVDDVVGLVRDAARADAPAHGKTQWPLTAIRKDGTRFQRSAWIRSLAVRGGDGIVIVLPPVQRAEESPSADAGTRGSPISVPHLNAVEQSLNSLLEIARGGPGLLSAAGGEHTESARPAIRAQAVNVMTAALACWEREQGKSKLDLAEASRIWPVYIDKSTPTTRTLDKYLNLETCPQNPRNRRVIDSAEFVLKQPGRKSTPERKKLQQALDDFRLLISGLKPPEV